MIKNKMIVLSMFIFFNLFSTDLVRADHRVPTPDVPGWSQKLSQLKVDLSILLTQFRFEEGSIKKIIEMAEWTVLDTAKNYSHAEANLTWFRTSLHSGFSYYFRGKWVSENPKISLEEKVNLMVKEVVESVISSPAHPGDPWAPPGEYTSVTGVFVFYRSWPPQPIPTDPPYYPAPTRRTYTFSGFRDSVYHQCLNTVYQNRIDFIVAIRANGDWLSNASDDSRYCDPDVISPMTVCRFIAAH